MYPAFGNSPGGGVDGIPEQTVKQFCRFRLCVKSGCLREFEAGIGVYVLVYRGDRQVDADKVHFGGSFGEVQVDSIAYLDDLIQSNTAATSSSQSKRNSGSRAQLSVPLVTVMPFLRRYQFWGRAGFIFRMSQILPLIVICPEIGLVQRREAGEWQAVFPAGRS